MKRGPSAFWRDLSWLWFSPTGLDLWGASTLLLLLGSFSLAAWYLKRTPWSWWPCPLSGWSAAPCSRPREEAERLGLCCRADGTYAVSPPPISSHDSGRPRCPSRLWAADVGNDPPPRLHLLPRLRLCPVFSLLCLCTWKRPHVQRREPVWGSEESVQQGEAGAPRPSLPWWSGLPAGLTGAGELDREEGTKEAWGEKAEGEKGARAESAKEGREAERETAPPGGQKRTIFVREWHPARLWGSHQGAPAKEASWPSTRRRTRQPPRWAWRRGCCRTSRPSPARRKRCWRGRWRSKSRRSSWCSCRSSGRRSGHWRQGQGKEGRGGGAGGGGGKSSWDPPRSPPAAQRRSCTEGGVWWAGPPLPHRRATWRKPENLRGPDPSSTNQKISDINDLSALFSTVITLSLFKKVLVVLQRPNNLN